MKNGLWYVFQTYCLNNNDDMFTCLSDSSSNDGFPTSQPLENGKKFTLGPRTYVELSELLREKGMYVPQVCVNELSKFS